MLHEAPTPNMILPNGLAATPPKVAKLREPNTMFMEARWTVVIPDAPLSARGWSVTGRSAQRPSTSFYRISKP